VWPQIYSVVGFCFTQGVNPVTEVMRSRIQVTEQEVYFPRSSNQSQRLTSSYIKLKKMH